MFRSERDLAAANIHPTIAGGDLAGKYLKRRASVPTGPRSLIATIPTALMLVSYDARRTNRPMQPKPLIATRTAMVRFVASDYHASVRLPPGSVL
jgi:hypothetical protein